MTLKIISSIFASSPRLAEVIVIVAQDFDVVFVKRRRGFETFLRLFIFPLIRENDGLDPETFRIERRDIERLAGSGQRLIELVVVQIGIGKIDVADGRIRVEPDRCLRGFDRLFNFVILGKAVGKPRQVTNILGDSASASR